MRQPLPVTLTLCLLLAISLLWPCLPQASEKKAEGKKTEVSHAVEKAPPMMPLWEKGQEFLQLGDIQGAARLLYLVHYHYPESAKGEPALWQAANLRKEMALTTPTPDWDTVLNLFRRYVNYYPKSPRAAEAYFELGKTYQAMRFHREAQAYFKLFMERYPDSPQVPQAMRSYRNSILRAGRGDEAGKVFARWLRSADPIIRQMGEVGEGILKSKQGDFPGALAIYQKILTASPDYPVTDPEILRYAGIANLRTGKVEEGREQLYHYLSLTGFATADRAEVLVELAESYYRAEEYETAQKLYRQVSSEGGGNERVVLLSNLRQAQMLDDPDIALSKWERHNDLNDRQGDLPYLAVLEKLYRDPIAQEARFGMFKRYQARGELDEAYEMGRNFLRSSEPAEASSTQGKRIGRILLYLVEALLQEKRYQEISDLYSAEYRHIREYPSAKLHAMVGQALEALSLYQPAAALYYLALQWPMSDEEKTDLYFRRARAYLALKDYDATDRLLTYLRKTYQGKPEAGEIAYYDAQLSAARGDIDKAHDLYLQAIKEPTFPEKRPAVVEEALELLTTNARLDQSSAVLTMAMAEKWLSPEKEQGWWLRIGNGWRQGKELAKARDAFAKGLEQGMPETGDAVQEIHLYLGDILMAEGDQEEGRKHYQAAGQGANPLWQRMAGERLTQQGLDAEMADLKERAAR